VLYVSTYWGYERPLDPTWLFPIARAMGQMLGWDEARAQEEVGRAIAGAATKARQA
jgi:hypothetical protein